MRRSRALLAALVLPLVAAAASAQPLASKLDTMPVVIEGVRFEVEVARTAADQFRGLGGRTWIDPHGGMLFPFETPRTTSFVMRDCKVPIDVAFLDREGRVVALHEMKPEPPRRPDESDIAYEERLRPYPSGIPVWFALETAGGRLREIGLEVGDRVDLGGGSARPRPSPEPAR